MWYYAAHAQWKLDNDESADFVKLGRTARSLSRLKNVLAVYTTVCCVYGLAKAGPYVRWPVFDTLVLFPLGHVVAGGR